MACVSSATWSMAMLKSALPSAPASVSVKWSSSASCKNSVPQPRLMKLSSSPRKVFLQQYSGLSALCPLFSPLPGGSGILGYNRTSRSTVHGLRIYAMRHGRRVPKLNRPPDQRRALLRGLTTQVIKYGRVKTTRARAKAVRKYVEKMITLAKEGSLHKRRQALGFIYEKWVVHALFAEAEERYGERNGGYTRIVRTYNRRGDNAPMAYIELVDD